MPGTKSSQTRVDLAGLPWAERQEFDRIVERFQTAWRGTSRPEISQFLPTENPLRLVVLRELVRIHFENRCKEGDDPRPDEHVSEFPELASDQALMKSLNAMRETAKFRSSATFTPVVVPLDIDAANAADPTIDLPGPTLDGAKPNVIDGVTPGVSPPPKTETDDLSSGVWSSIKPGMTLGNYRILERIGRGGMGAVFKAEHRRMNRVVAIKTISPAALRSPEAVQRFHREVEAVARLDHPNIVTAYDADQFGTLHVMVMQFVEGSDLATRVKRDGPLSVEKALAFLQQAAKGLEYAHRRGVVHRDIKPANLLVDAEGNLKITDMGLARFDEQAKAAEGLTNSGNIMGTIDFMSPEQALDAKQADCRSDVYSLGCTLYYVLTGKHVYSGDTVMKKLLAHREAPIPQLKSARPDVPASIQILFERMVAKRPQNRYQTMTELLAGIPRSRPVEAAKHFVAEQVVPERANQPAVDQDTEDEIDATAGKATIELPPLTGVKRASASSGTQTPAAEKPMVNTPTAEAPKPLSWRPNRSVTPAGSYPSLSIRVDRTTSGTSKRRRGWRVGLFALGLQFLLAPPVVFLIHGSVPQLVLWPCLITAIVFMVASKRAR